MRLYLFQKPDGNYANAFRELALHHNVRISRLFAATIAVIGLVLTAIDRFTGTSHVFRYPFEYSAAIRFIFLSSCSCYAAFILCKKLNRSVRFRINMFLARAYPIVVVISSLWITFVMQHNPSNTMSIFVLGLLMVASLWIFDRAQALFLALLILVLFNGGLHYFQTDPCKLVANYITGTCVTVFFVFISRISFSVNYNHFIQLKKIEQYNQEITEANERQAEVLSIVAHDLRAPLNSVIGLTDILKNLEMPREEQGEYYSMILDTCSRSKAIIDELLDTAGAVEYKSNFMHTCMNDLIEDIAYTFIKRKGYTRQIIYKKETEKIYAFVDRHKIIRLFENLLDNAVKFTYDNGMITIKMNHDNDKIYILVTDNGIGIPPKLIPTLFNKFSRSGRQGLNGEKSYGLGLNICKLITEQHHGTISVQSEEGAGTQIKITLPVADKFKQ